MTLTLPALIVLIVIASFAALSARRGRRRGRVDHFNRPRFPVVLVYSECGVDARRSAAECFLAGFSDPLPVAAVA